VRAFALTLLRSAVCYKKDALVIRLSSPRPGSALIT
jgi:hypothetical protein